MQEGRGGYGAHTVKNWWARRTCGSHRRERSEGRSKGKRGEKDKKTKKKPVEKKSENFLTPTLARIDRPAKPRRL